jgi:hypothetical protein
MFDKIDIFVNGIYVCSTNQSKTCKEAKDKFLHNPVYMGINGLTKIDFSDMHRVSCVLSK